MVEHQQLEFEIEPITISNPEAEAYRAVAMGQPQMMIRELIKNAEEACRNKPNDQRQIRVYGTDIDGIKKLTIWNRGGMPLGALLEFANINVEIDKTNDLDRNYGRGAKIASLMSNQHGLRYRSCVGGRVLQITLCVDSINKLVGPIQVANPVSGTTTVEDVTAEFTNPRNKLPVQWLLPRSGVAQDLLSIDWTEVVLLGNEHDQDTTERPYLHGNVPPSEWLMNAIGMRFFRIADGVELKVHSKITRARATDYWIGFDPMFTTLEFAGCHSIVPFEQGSIYYILPEQREGQGTRQRSFATQFATKPFGGIIYQDEIYYLHSGKGRGQTTLESKTWPPLALDWGLARAYDRVCILVELNDGQARTDINRTHLKDLTGSQIDPEHFSAAVRENMPEWVKELERSLEPGIDEHIKSTHQWLIQQMREFKNMQDDFARGGDLEGVIVLEHNGPGPGPRPDPNPDPDPGPDPGPNPGPVPELEGAVRLRPRQRTMNAPLAEWVNEAWFADLNHPGMAAKFVKGSPGHPAVLYFNEDHVFFHNVVERIIQKLPEGPDAYVRRIAKAAAKDVFYRVAGIQAVSTISLSHINVRESDVVATLSELMLTATLAGAYLTKHFIDAVKRARHEFQAQWTRLGEEEVA